MSRFSIINGELLPAEKAAVLITDLAVQRGYGIFDFFKILGNKPVFLEDHLNRFYHSAGAMRLPVMQSRAELKALFEKLATANNIPYSGIRITLTGGYSADGYTMAEPNMIITQQTLVLQEGVSENGIRLITHPYQRQFAHAKTLDYLMAVWLQPVIKAHNADDVLYHYNGKVTECPRANFFIVNSEGQLLTARSNMLMGVIRKQVLSIAAKHNLLKDEDITFDGLKSCKEAFITSTTKNILPVTMIDGKMIGNGTPGAVTRLLADKLNRLIKG